MEERQREAEDVLELLLQGVKSGALFVGHLSVNLLCRVYRSVYADGSDRPETYIVLAE